MVRKQERKGMFVFWRVVKTKRGKWAVVLALFAFVGAACTFSNNPFCAVFVGVFLFCISIALFMAARASTISQPVKPVNIEPIYTAKDSIEISVETRTIDVDRFIAPGEIITCVDIGYVSPSGGFVNWGLFDVTGTNAVTHRKNKRQYDAKTEAGAIAKAEKDGLTAPFEVIAVAHDKPTEKQIAYLESWGVAIPDGATKIDVSAILSRLEDSYDVVSEKRASNDSKTEWIRPLPSPSYEFAEYADSTGLKFSQYIGKDALFKATVHNLSSKDRAAFYAYCILCANDKTEIGDLRKYPKADQLSAFAEYATNNQAIMQSIDVRDSYDYMHPHKGSNAYKAVAAYFHL